MAKTKGINTKKAAGNEKKAANKAAKEFIQIQQQEQQDTIEWNKGSNIRSSNRNAMKQQKEEDERLKKASKAALVQLEEAEMEANGASASKVRSNSQKSNSKSGSGGSKKKNKKKDALSLLEDSLIGDADKKAKAAKKKERLRKERDERLRLEKERMNATSASASGTASASAIQEDPLLANTNAMLGNTITGGNGNTLNATLIKGEIDASGIDSALKSMGITNSKTHDHPTKNLKAYHMAFVERMMPEMKEQYPGLKRNQYLDKIFTIWKKSSENPLNWPNKE